MKIHHIALWVNDLEMMRRFYANYFGICSNEKYNNLKTGFESYFLNFPDEGCKIELMTTKDAQAGLKENDHIVGLAHFAISVGSSSAVDQLTHRLREDGYTVVSDPRWTGDGFYESVILDPEGNRIELTI